MGAVDPGTAGENEPVEKGEEVETTKCSGPSKRCPLSVTLKDTDHLGAERPNGKKTVILHLATSEKHTKEKGASVEAYATIGLAEAVLGTGPVDVTPDTASLGLISASNCPKEAEAATKLEVSPTGNKNTRDEKKETPNEPSPCTNVAKIVEDKKHASTNVLKDKPEETAVASFGTKSLMATLPV